MGCHLRHGLGRRTEELLCISWEPRSPRKKQFGEHLQPRCFSKTRGSDQQAHYVCNTDGILCYWTWPNKGPQIQPNQFPGDILLNSRRFLRDKPYNIKMQVKFAMSISEHGMMSSDQCSSLCLRSQWSCLPEDFTMYSALKTARRAKITLLIIKFSRSINKIPGNFQYFQEQF